MIKNIKKKMNEFLERNEGGKGEKETSKKIRKVIDESVFFMEEICDRVGALIPRIHEILRL